MEDSPNKFSDLINPGQGLRRLYEARRLGLGALNTRNRLTMVFALVILTLLASAFTNRAQSIDHWRGFVNQRKDIKILDSDKFVYRVSTPQRIPCNDECRRNGMPKFNQTVMVSTSLAELNRASLLSEVSEAQKKNPIWSQLEITIPANILNDELLAGKNLVIGLPPLQFRGALLSINNTLWARLADSERILIRGDRDFILGHDMKVSLILELPDSGVVYDSAPVLMPAYISTSGASKDLSKFLLLDRDTRGSVISTMSRILIAFFALFIFVVIDSTPESFGLAMFLGCEAVALVLGERWLSLPADKFYIHTFYQIGDIFRLYFFVQISRMFRPHTLYWLGSAITLSIPYGYFRFMETQWGVHGLDMIPRLRDFTVGSIGTILCIAALISIRSEKLPWRKAALLLGAACSFQQVLGPLTYYFPHWNNSAALRHFFTSYETLSSYFGALSALTNISTLENRVSRLSLAKVHGDMIENELALGQTVQKSFMNAPNLPKSFELAQSHEAAVYVSGDIFFMNWNDRDNRLVLLMCDVTGHGVQAALKATACYMLARNIWMGGEALGASSKERFDRFRSEQEDLMKLFSDTPDIPTFSCLEIFPTTSTYFSYRTNFNAPLIIEPAPYGGWSLRSEVMRDGVTRQTSLRPGSLIAVFSDGYVATSRHLVRLTRHIEKNLPTFDGSPDGFKELIREYDRLNPSRPDDDRTLVVISWQRSQARHTSAALQRTLVQQSA